MLFQAEEEAEEEEEEEEEDIEAVLAEEFEVRKPLLLYKHSLVWSENDWKRGLTAQELEMRWCWQNSDREVKTFVQNFNI